MRDDLEGSLSMARVRQRLPRPRVEALSEEIAAKMERLAPYVRPGMSVAVTAGSRGINAIPLVLRTVVSALSGMGARPYLVSAMGSHGGETAEGQRNLLAHLGITEESVGAPLRVTSDAEAVGTTESGHVLYADAEALKADAILPVNRIKVHTAFQDNLASGLFKMLTVGLGKGPGARQVHKLSTSGICRAIVEMGRLALERLPVIGGLAIIENGYEETALVEVLLPSEMERREQELLEYARDILPALPVRRLDLLIVEEMGKNFSGTGMDTNVIGRWKAEGIPEPEFPKIGRIVVLRLSAASEGNANGIGLADVTTRELALAIDWMPTLTNVRTTGLWQRAFCPPFPGGDRDAIRWALDGLGLLGSGEIAAARIRNTLHIEELMLTPAALKTAQGCEQIGPVEPLAFSAEGDLLPG
jgi:hypothetical protein